MYYILWNILGMISIALADYTFDDPVFNQDAIPKYLSDYGYPSSNVGFNPGAAFPEAIVQSPTSPQVSSFNPPQELNAWSVLPIDFRSDQATGDIDSNPYPVQPSVALTFPQVGSINTPQEEKTPYYPACRNGKSHFSDAVRAFASNFAQRIQSSPVYTDAFSLQNSSLEYATKVFYDYIYKLNKKKGDIDPEFSAYTASQALKKNYDFTNTVRFIEVHGFTVGQLMYQTGQLTTENALELSNEYFQVTADAIDGVAVNTLKLSAVMAGVENFLTKYNVYSLAFTVPAVFYQVYFTLNENCS